MSREKQIEEMAKALTKYEYSLCERLPKDKCLLTSAVHAQVSCDYCKIAEFLYNAGYRKQSEVIHCRDCGVPHNKWTGCPKLNGLVPHSDFYCAYAEPKMKGGAE